MGGDRRRSNVLRFLATVLVVLGPILGLAPDVLPGLGPVGAGAAVAGSQDENGDQIQILGVVESDAEVVMDIAVPPSIGRLAPTRDNFEVADGDQLVDLAVASAGTAADVVLVIDTSGSMQGSAIAAAKAAAAGFLTDVADDARVGLVSFGDTVIVHQEPTLDRGLVRSELADLEATGQETVLWDALLVAADALDGTTGARSSVVVLSDGDDTASVASPTDVVGRLGGGGAALYAVAIESPDTDLVGLEAAVDGIGGQFLATSDVDQLGLVYADIAGRLANRYQLRFAPVADGERTVVVAVATETGVATAEVMIGMASPGGGLGAGEPSAADGAANPPPVLNLDDRPTLGLVPARSPGRFGSKGVFWAGLASMFAALSLAGLLVARPRKPVRINAAASVDRVEGVNVRLGKAADRMISRHDRAGRIDRRLEAAEINLRPGEFLVIWLLVAGGGALLAWAVVGVAAAVLAVLLAAAVAVLMLQVRAGRRRARFADQLTETLGIMASSLRAGQSLPRSIELVASEAPSPTAEQFHRIAFEIRVGRDVTESIRDASVRMASPDLEWLAQAVDINRVLGGDLTEILDNVASTIRERRTVARQVNAMSAEGRATGWVLIVMPVLLFVLTWWRTPDSIERLVTVRLGQILLGLAIAGMVIGHLWIRKLVKVTY